MRSQALSQKCPTPPFFVETQKIRMREWGSFAHNLRVVLGLRDLVVEKRLLQAKRRFYFIYFFFIGFEDAVERFISGTLSIFIKFARQREKKCLLAPNIFYFFYFIFFFFFFFFFFFDFIYFIFLFPFCPSCFPAIPFLSFFPLWVRGIVVPRHQQIFILLELPLQVTLTHLDTLSFSSPKKLICFFSVIVIYFLF